MDEDQPVTLISDGRTVRGLLTIVRRAAMSEFEAIQVETVFGDWFRQIDDQAKQSAALDRLAALAHTTARERFSDEATAAMLDQIDQPPAGAAGDVLADATSPPDEASGPYTNGATETLAV